MRTDTTHIHLQLLLGIRDQQHQELALLQDIAECQGEGIRLLRGIGKLLRDQATRPSNRWTVFLPQGMVSTGLQYAVTLVAVIYLLKGGDLEKLAGIMKLFGLP